MKNLFDTVFNKNNCAASTKDMLDAINKILFQKYDSICPVCGELLTFKAGVKLCHNCGYVKTDALVMVEKDRLRSLMIGAYKFAYLEAGGVDNWEGYSAAIREGIKEDRETLEIKADSVEDIADYMLDNGLV